MKMKSGYKGRLKGVLPATSDYFSAKIQHPYLDVEKNILISTGGKAIVILPVIVEDGETSGPVHSSAIANMLTGLKKRKATLHCGERVVVKYSDGEESSYSRSGLEFVKWEAAMPKRAGRSLITVNAHYLSSIQTALDSMSISIWIDGENNAILMSGDNKQDGMAALMPMRGGFDTPVALSDLKVGK